MESNTVESVPNKSISRKGLRGDLSLALRKKDHFQEWDIDGEYKFEKILGSGSYGEVAQAIQLTTGKRVAIKKMDNIF